MMLVDGHEPRITDNDRDILLFLYVHCVKRDVTQRLRQLSSGRRQR